LFNEENLRGADLSGAIFRTVYHRYFKGDTGHRGKSESADLRKVDFRGANLQGVDLRSADLTGSNLSGAYIGEADLSNANLYRCNIQGANFEKSRLDGVDLERVSGIPESVDSCTFDYTTCRESKWSNEQIVEFLNAGAVPSFPKKFPEEIQSIIAKIL